MAGEVEGFEAADYLRPHLAHRFNKASAPSNTSSVLHLFNSLSKSVVAAFYDAANKSSSSDGCVYRHARLK